MDEELLLSCICHGYHYVELQADKDFGLMISHIERPRQWKEKLQCIWKIVRGEEIFDGELLIKSKDYKKVQNWFLKARKLEKESK